MATVLEKGKDIVYEDFKCPICDAIFRVKAEDITITDHYEYQTGKVKCPNCTNYLWISKSDCSTNHLRYVFSRKRRSAIKVNGTAESNPFTSEKL